MINTNINRWQSVRLLFDKHIIEATLSPITVPGLCRRGKRQAEPFIERRSLLIDATVAGRGTPLFRHLGENYDSRETKKDMKVFRKTKKSSNNIMMRLGHGAPGVGLGVKV